MYKALLLLLFSTFSWGQLRPEIREIFEELEKKPSTGSQFNYYSGELNTNAVLYEKLDTLATVKELEYMIKKGKKDTVVSLYYFLTQRNVPTILFTLFEYYLKNDQNLYIQTGCTGFESSISAEFFQAIQNELHKVEEREKFTPQEFESLKEVYRQNDLLSNWKKEEVLTLLKKMEALALSWDQSSDKIIEKIIAYNSFQCPNYYMRIRFFAQKYPTPILLAGLATFQHQDDIPFIAANYPTSLLAISKFPDSKFAPLLFQKHPNTVFELAEAIGAMRHPEALELYTHFVQNYLPKLHEDEYFIVDEEIINQFYMALEKNQSPVAKEFLRSLWVDYRIISLSFFDEMKKDYLNELYDGFCVTRKITFVASTDRWFEQHVYPENSCEFIKKYLVENISDSHKKELLNRCSCTDNR